MTAYQLKGGGHTAELVCKGGGLWRFYFSQDNGFNMARYNQLHTSKYHKSPLPIIVWIFL